MSTTNSISCDEMMKPMLAACPSFAPHWKEFLDEWVDEPVLSEDGEDGRLPLYLALSDLADHLIKQLEAGDTKEFPAAFAVVERWINEGDDYVSEAAVVGLLEDLSSKGRYKRATLRGFVPWLGPQSLKWWAEVIDFWERLDKGKFQPLSIE